MTSVLFVCMGNICRSPMAEGAFRAAVETAGLSEKIHIDSAGTIGYTQGLHLTGVRKRQLAAMAWTSAVNVPARLRTLILSNSNIFLPWTGITMKT